MRTSVRSGIVPFLLALDIQTPMRGLKSQV